MVCSPDVSERFQFLYEFLFAEALHFQFARFPLFGLDS